MRSLRTLAAYAVTVLVTLALVLAVFGGRMRAQRPQPPQTIVLPPFRPPASVQPPALSKPPTARPSFDLPQVAALDLPPELLKEADAEEQVNIRVYAATNRS